MSGLYTVYKRDGQRDRRTDVARNASCGKNRSHDAAYSSSMLHGLFHDNITANAAVHIAMTRGHIDNRYKCDSSVTFSHCVASSRTDTGVTRYVGALGPIWFGDHPTPHSLFPTLFFIPFPSLLFAMRKILEVFKDPRRDFSAFLVRQVCLHFRSFEGKNNFLQYCYW